VLVLTTTGRRSGRPRSTPVAYLREGDSFVISGANAGLDRPPAWWLNLQADPDAEIEVGGRRLAVRAHAVKGAERDRLRARFLQQNAGADTTASFTIREVPIIVLEPRSRVDQA
jgi:deazaflavin-dependent oxidoreductase (nitroreductase family)